MTKTSEKDQHIAQLRRLAREYEPEQPDHKTWAQCGWSYGKRADAERRIAERAPERALRYEALQAAIQAIEAIETVKQCLIAELRQGRGPLADDPAFKTAVTLIENGFIFTKEVAEAREVANRAEGKKGAER